MKILTLAIGAAGAAALAGAAAPASAQYYPGSPYGYNQPGNVIGQVLNQVLNPYANQYSQGYGMHSQAAVQRCTAAVQQRLSMQYRAGYSPYGAYSPYGGYNTATNARVLGITRIEQRSRSTVRVRGVASSGQMYGRYGGYGGYGGYGYAQQSPDLIFRCDVDYRGYIRDIDIDRID
ncbi:MAG: hypothetical protein ACR2JJ_03035 [Sphingomicrobium sp.]